MRQDTIAVISDSLSVVNDGQTADVTSDVSLPIYYKETFFSKDSLLHPELRGGRQGVAGDPIPYTIAGDNLITGLLLLCIIITLTAIRYSYQYFFRQAKRFFYVVHENTSEISETRGEFYMQLFLVGQASLLFSMMFMLLTREKDNYTFTVEYYEMIGIYALIFLGYFFLKFILYQIVDLTFFDGKKNKQWKHSFLLLISLESILLIPLVLFAAFFNLTVHTGIIYTISLLVLIKLLTLYKTFIIFFKQTGVFLQIILYFCALEIVPLSLLWSGLELTNSLLKINF